MRKLSLREVNLLAIASIVGTLPHLTHLGLTISGFMDWTPKPPKSASVCLRALADHRSPHAQQARHARELMPLEPALDNDLQEMVYKQPSSLAPCMSYP